ncbi:MAG TPA: NAD-dependent epimerase/dehydratase family protein, partial [Polyangiaceae bacterium]|nr:NAD-dependent epimerase/dehydratase family protein [Polyangiaceae bacterium]
GLQYMIQRLVRGEAVELYDGGEAMRDYLYVDDVCRALKTCVERAPLGEIVNVGSGVPLAVGELVEYCRLRLGSQSRVERVETPAFRRQVQARDFWLDVTRLTRLGFAPSVDFQSGLDRVMDAELALAGKLPLPARP